MDWDREEAAGRDKELLGRMSSAVDFLAGKMKNWIELEATRLVPRVQQLVLTNPETAGIGGPLHMVEQDLQDVVRRESVEVWTRYDERSSEIEGGMYDDCQQSLGHLFDSVSGLAGLMRKLYQLRELVNRVEDAINSGE